MSTTLKICRFLATWITRPHPQPGPHDKPAVPLPFGFREKMVNGVPVVTGSPHPEVCDLMVAELEPWASRVNVTTLVLMPHPVSPVRVICHGPARLAKVIASSSC